MRDYKIEFENRVKFIKNLIENSHTNGIVFGNSGGKDSALVGILCKKACENTVGIILPCGVKSNFSTDFDDAISLAKQFDIETRVVDLTTVKNELMNVVGAVANLNEMATTNISPRLRMTALYAVSASENRLVAGTGNRSERYVGYFTKWGDGAHDFNPISDLTATEVFEFLRFLKVSSQIIDKAPSAGLKEGQTDEKEMGITYGELDSYITTKKCVNLESKKRIERLHSLSEHKRHGIEFYNNINE